jgi:hypothetical protein
MKYFQFHSVVAHLVRKVADRTITEVDPDFDPRDYFDAGAEKDDQILNAHLAATEVLEANGFLSMEIVPEAIQVLVEAVN